MTKFINWFLGLIRFGNEEKSPTEPVEVKKKRSYNRLTQQQYDVIWFMRQAYNLNKSKGIEERTIPELVQDINKRLNSDISYRNMTNVWSEKIKREDCIEGS